MTVLLIAHISIALLSVITATLTLLAPTHNRLRINYAFVVSTVTSGTVLVMVSHARLFSACVSGLAYIVAISAILFGAQHRLAREPVRIKNR